MRVVIFCGGFGTRMWPASRKSNPKQFYPFFKGKSFFRLTYERFLKAFKPVDIFVSTEERYVDRVIEIAPEVPRENIISEPERKDNLAAIGLVTALLEKRFPGEVMIVSWSDHFIANDDVFLKAVKVAGLYAKETGLIVSVNEEPKSPSIHNEWVKLGESLGEVNGMSIVRIAETIKRPDKETARKLFSSQGYLINTGYRAWRTDIMLSYYKQFVPEMYDGLIKISEADGSKLWETILYREYHKFVKDSVEFGIFVKLPADKSATIPSNFGWEDAGTWELFYEAVKTKEEENVIIGGMPCELMDSRGNLIIGEKNKVIATIGVSNLAIIDTPQGLLVCNLKESGKVKEVFAILEKTNSDYVE